MREPKPVPLEKAKSLKSLKAILLNNLRAKGHPVEGNK